MQIPKAFFLFTTSLAALATAMPQPEDGGLLPGAGLEESRAAQTVACPCSSTESCGCNSVVAGSWCYCVSGTVAYPYAPCMEPQSCGCNFVEAGSWGYCL